MTKSYPLNVENVLAAYKRGMFPMSESAESDGVFWVEPVYRGILPLDRLIVSTSLKKALKKNDYEIRINHDFESVIHHCALRAKGDKNTWINADIKRVYGELFALNHVHTLEVYRENRLIGGLYGVAIGGAFFGESMFHLETNASKIALVHLVAHLKLNGFKLLDTQFITAHLASLGAIEIKQKLYLLLLQDALRVKGEFKNVIDFKGEALFETLKTKPYFSAI